MSKTKIDIGFAGTPEIALEHLKKVLESKKINTKFILTQPNKKTGRGLAEKSSIFEEHKLKTVVLQPENLNGDDLKRKIESHPVDILLVVAYGKLLPKWLLDHPSVCCLNVHFSLLPLWRGAAPIQRSIEHGDKETGISFMKLTEGLDEGPVYKSIKVNSDGMDFYSVEQELLKTSLDAIEDILIKIAQNKLAPVIQNDKQASYASKIEKSEAAIAWGSTAETIKNKFNAFKKWPGTSFVVSGQEVQVLSLEIDEKKQGKPGEIEGFDKDSLRVFCRNGVIKITSVKFPGKKVINSVDFFNSKRDIISIGDFLI